MSFATPVNLGNTCGGTVTATNGVLALSGITMLASATCQVNADVNVSTAGAITNTTGAITSNESGPGLTASATLTGIAPPSLSKSFGSKFVTPNVPVVMTLALTNLNTGTALTGVSVTDTLPTGMILYSPANLNNTCGGTANAANGQVTLTGVTLAANGTCSVTVQVTMNTPNTVINTATVNSANAGPGTPATAQLSGVAATPTLTEWGTMLLFAMISLLAVRQLKTV